MKKHIYLPILLVITFSLIGCMTSSHMKCPGFTAKRLTPNTGHSTYASRHYKKSKEAKSVAQHSEITAQDDNGLMIGGGRTKEVEIQLPKLYAGNISNDEIQGLNEIFKVESNNTLRLEKKSDDKIVLHAKSAAALKHVFKSIAKRAAAPGGGGGGMALASGILGIIGFVLAFGWYAGFVAFVCALLAIILGIFGLGSRRRGWAIVGIVLGVITIAVAFLFVFAVFHIG